MDAVGPLVSPLLVGRDDLLELAGRRLDEATGGRGQFLLIAGEAGIGKTRFVAAIEGMAADRQVRVVSGDLAPQDQDVPAASILDLARTAARDPAFGTLGPDLLGRREAAFATEHGRRRILVTDIVELFHRALDRTTVLVFEDLQWADELSLEIIAEVARVSRDLPVLIVGTYRFGDALPGTSLREWRSRLVTQRLAEEMRLGQLDREQTALVTTLILDTGLPAPREVVDAVYERTDGIPLHIEELLGAMSAQARADGRAIREATVPETIEDAVLEQLARRSPEAQAVARAGSVIGRCFVSDVLAGIMDVAPDTLDDPIQELLDSGVLTPPESRGLYDFRHQLLRDAIYETVSLRDRRRFHARAGEFGARLEGQSEIHASLHYERAGLRQLAFEAALSGAREAAALSAHREAFELYGRAIDNQPDGLPTGALAGLLQAYGGEAAALEETELAEDLARQAAAAFRRAGDPVAAIGAEGELVLSMWRRDMHPVSERVRFATQLLEELDALPESPEAVRVRGDLAYYLALARIDGSDFAGARAANDVARSASEALGDQEILLLADGLDGLVAFVEDGPAAGMARLVAVAEAAEHGDHEVAALGAMREACTSAVLALDYAAAAERVEAGLRYADAVEQSHCAHIIAATSTMVAWAAGHWDAAVAAARQALADRGCLRGAMAARLTLGYVALGRGDTAVAEAELGAALAAGARSEENALILPPAWGLAELASLAGDTDGAEGRCRDVLDRARSAGERALLVPFVVTGVRAATSSGRLGSASAWLADCEAQLGSFEAGAAALAHGRGLVALMTGSTGVARTELAEAIRGWDAIGRIWESTWARLDLAECHVRTGRFVEASALAIEARETASRLDSRPLAERADAIARSVRGRGAADQPWHPLTAREFEVARLIGEGCTNAEIADVLGIAPKTASAHVEHILAKLGASRRAEIATWASQVDRSPAAVH